MERLFTKAVGRFKLGEVRDYAASVWAHVARSAKRPLDTFTKPVQETAREAVVKLK